MTDLDPMDLKTDLLRVSPMTMTLEGDLEDVANGRQRWALHVRAALDECEAMRAHVLALAGERRRLLDLRRRYEKALAQAGQAALIEREPEATALAAPGARAIRRRKWRT